MRTIAQAAKEAVQGLDETLWQAVMEHVQHDIPRRTVLICETDYMRVNEAELIIREFSPAQLKLYDISSEAEK